MILVFKKMFENFNFEILSDIDFKEDSVREEIILPIIKKLGYSASGDNRIIRSKGLVHPYVSIGSKRNKINIYPDYVFLSNEKPYWVLDAKSPSEEITKSAHVEQAYSYAIHPEIRVRLYALCNGKQFVLYDIQKIEPIMLFDIQDIDDNWDTLNRLLNPKIKAKPELVEYDLDYGLAMFKFSQYNADLKIVFTSINTKFIMKHNDNLYSVSTTIPGDRDLLASIDLSAKQYQELLDLLDPALREEVSFGLTRMPYIVETSKDIQFGCKGHLSPILESNNEEDYIPIIVDEIFPYVDIPEI